MRYILPIPPSINSYYSQSRSGHRYKTDAAKDWEVEASWKLIKHKKYGAKRITVTLEYYFKNNRSDISNRTKILHDLLQKMEIIDNDNQIYANHEYKFIDKDERVEMEVSEFEQ